MIISFVCLKSRKSWKYFATKQWNKQANDISTTRKMDIREVTSKISLTDMAFLATAACYFFV